jgi:hypothetical protein
MGGIQSNPKIDKLIHDIDKVNNITQSDLFKKKFNSKIWFSNNWNCTSLIRLLPSSISVNIVKF